MTNTVRNDDRSYRLQRDSVAALCSGCFDGTRGELDHIASANKEWADSPGLHIAVSSHDSPLFVYVQDIDWKSHPHGMY